MTAVVLRLAGPVQSWGDRPRGVKTRPTSDHPTLSGVIGLVANILGRGFDDTIEDLTGLGFAVREDRAGTLMADLHAAGNGRGDYPLLPGDFARSPKLRDAAAAWDKANPDATAMPTSVDLDYKYMPVNKITAAANGELRPGPSNPALTTDEFLSDAIFTVALTGPSELVAQIAQAAKAPARTPFLGRAANLPSEQLFLAVSEHDDPVDALAQTALHRRADQGPHRVWDRVRPGTAGSVLVTDVPVDFRSRQRVARGERLNYMEATA